MSECKSIKYASCLATRYGGEFHELTRINIANDQGNFLKTVKRNNISINRNASAAKTNGRNLSS